MKHSLTIALLLASTSLSHAVDNSKAWTGFYGSARMGYTIKGDANNKPLATANDAVKMNGFGSGFALGYSYQTGSFVIGMVGEIAARSVKSNNAIGGALSVPAETNITFNFGYVLNKTTMVYGITGVSAAVITSKTSILGVESKETRNAFGFIAGAGLEYRLHKNWSLFGEYRFTNFETIQFNGFAANISPTTHDIRTGVNYRF